MKTAIDKLPCLLRALLAAGVMLLSSGAFAALIAWIPVSTGASPDTLPASPVAREKPGTLLDAGTTPLKEYARGKVKCAECGLIESIRKIEEAGESPSAAAARSGGHEITVRLQDGSSRVMTDANPGRWRLGERVMIIDGLADSGA
ncbi:MAG: hypothetical protein WBO23_14470 [Burkholderiales bacterium]